MMNMGQSEINMPGQIPVLLGPMFICRGGGRLVFKKEDQNSEYKLETEAWRRPV